MRSDRVQTWALLLMTGAMLYLAASLNLERWIQWFVSFQVPGSSRGPFKPLFLILSSIRPG